MVPVQRIVAEYRAGNFTSAEQLCREGLKESPEDPNLWCMLGILLRNLDQLDEAAESLNTALQIRPDFTEAKTNLANVFLSKKEYDKAISIYHQLLPIEPNSPQIYNNLGAALRYQERWQEAAECYQRAIQLQPDCAAAYNNLGDVLIKLERLDQAVARFRDSIRIEPDHFNARRNLGYALSESGLYEEALEHYNYAIQLRPDDAEAHLNVAATLWRMKKFNEAEQRYRHTLSLRPDYDEAYIGLGASQLNLGLSEEALVSFNEAVRLNPTYASAYGNRAQVQVALGEMEGAVDDLSEAIRLEPEEGQWHLGRSLVRLMQGNYEEGWPEYEWRFKCKAFVRPTCDKPLWDGSDLKGKTIALLAEQGLGDTVQFARYGSAIKQLGGKAVLVCQKPLVSLMSTCPNLDLVVAFGDPFPEVDVHLPLLSVAHLVSTTLETIPGEVPYVSPDQQLVEFWKNKMRHYPGFKVGVVWQGNPDHPADYLRSFPLSKYAPLASVPGVQVFSLQKGFGREQLKNAGFPIVDLWDKVDEANATFTDTAAMLKSLDLLISADTSVIHVAGALAVPAWVLLGRFLEWRWLWGHQKTPWYPSLRLFRPQRRFHWDDVFTEVVVELKRLIQASKSD